MQWIGKIYVFFKKIRDPLGSAKRECPEMGYANVIVCMGYETEGCLHTYENVRVLRSLSMFAHL